MSSNKKKLNFNSVSVDLGCSSCKRPKLSTIFHPKPKPKLPPYQKHKHSLHPNNYYFHSSSSSSSSSSSTYTSSSKTTTNPSPDTNTSPPPQFMDDRYHSSSCPGRAIRGFGRVGGQSVAVEKESDDPYLDFRHSMLQMILEKEIYSKDDLRELLNCFLQLNSPYYHGVIVRAFTEIWNGVFSVRSSGGNSNFNGSASAPEKLHYHHHYYYGCNSRDF